MGRQEETPKEELPIFWLQICPSPAHTNPYSFRTLLIRSSLHTGSQCSVHFCKPQGWWEQRLSFYFSVKRDLPQELGKARKCPFNQVFFYWFSEYLRTAYCVLGTILGIGNTIPQEQTRTLPSWKETMQIPQSSKCTRDIEKGADTLTAGQDRENRQY